MTAWISSVHCDCDVVILVSAVIHIFSRLSDDSVLTEPELTEPGCVWCHVTPGLESRHHRHSLSLLTEKYFSREKDREGQKEKLFWQNLEYFQMNILGGL